MTQNKSKTDAKLCGSYGHDYISEILSISNEKPIVFQSKYLVFRSKTSDFDRNTRHFESESLKY